MDVSRILRQVQNPARYVGGEYGAIKKEGDALFTIALCFPDLYEIGMSNTAIRILYSLLNELDGVRCERVFAPAPDFREALTNHSIPLFTLESRIPLSNCDLIGFSMGYELSVTNMLACLDLGNIPLSAAQRREGDPIVIAGGPAVSNPFPFSDFLDAVFIGEAEEPLPRITKILAQKKQKNAGRDDLLSVLYSEESVWFPEKKEITRKAIWQGFGRKSSIHRFPVPNIRIVQDHGTVEIMRGCIQGCRFCHAGYFYRPCRMKGLKQIIQEVDYLVRTMGYRHITLSSLSTGDYAGIEELIQRLNTSYSTYGVSFALPSIKMNSFSLNLLNEISAVRRSGLTFAVETPRDAWQMSINKTVSFEQTVCIIHAAKKRGWNLAKFYFMIGLPHSDRERECEEILDFVHQVRDATKIRINLNLGTFVPKPHTAYQWASQIPEETALEMINKVKRGLRHRSIKIGYHMPFQSHLEGLISRGDARMAGVILQAYKEGAYLDAWDDHMRRDVWKRVIAGSGEDFTSEILRERSLDETLPWDGIDLGIRKSYLKAEYRRSEKNTLTEQCIPECVRNCGVCDELIRIELPREEQLSKGTETESGPALDENQRLRIIFRYAKRGSAAFIPHTGLICVFERASLRADLPLSYSKGFNPKPKLEFAQPLATGMQSEEEIASIIVYNNKQAHIISNELNRVFPSGLHITDSMELPLLIEGKKLPSLMSIFWGGRYEIALSNSSKNKQLFYEFLEETRIAESETPDPRIPELEVGERREEISAQLTVNQAASGGKGITNIMRSLGISKELEEEIRIRRLKTFAVKRENSGRSPQDSEDFKVKQDYFDYFRELLKREGIYS